MDKILIKDIDAYRKWAFALVEEHSDPHVDRALGLRPVRECWDTIDGVDVDEDGNPIPDDTAENVEIKDWVKELQFPVVAVYCFEREYDRMGTLQIAFAEFVSITEFSN